MKTPTTPRPLPVPCAAWAHRLAALQPDDLASTEQLALKRHLASCRDCAAAYSAYQTIDISLLSLPVVQPSARQIAQLEASIADQTQNNPRWKPGPMLPERLALPPRKPLLPARLERRINLLAAILVVLVLAGGTFGLFAARHNTGLTGTGASGTIYAVSSTGVVYAIDASNGKTIWSTPLHAKASEQFLVSDGKIFLGTSDDYLYALQTSDGQQLWKRSYKSLTTVDGQTVEVAPYPASDGKAIYFGTPTGIYAWSASDGLQLWHYPTPSTCNAQEKTCAPEVETINNGLVYAYFDGLYALNTADGTLSWKNVKVSATQLLVAQNHVYVMSYNGGTLGVLQASNGQLLNTPDLPKVTPFDFLTDGNRVYLRSGVAGISEDIYAIQASNNRVLWHKPENTNLLFSGVGGGLLYYTYTKNTVVSQQPSVVVSATSRNKIIPQQAYPYLCAINVTDGSKQWCQQVLPSFSPLIVSQGILYMSPMSGLEATRLSDNKVLWVALQSTSLAHLDLV